MGGILTDLSSGKETTITDEEVTGVQRVSGRRVVVDKKAEGY